MEAIIFDVDGTLWDATDEIVYSWNQALEGWPSIQKRLTGEMLTPEFGKPMNEIMEDLFPELSVEEQERLAKDLYLLENHWVETAPCHIYEGLPETIKELSRNYKLMIVSNSQAGYIEAFLKNTGLGSFFIDHLCYGDTEISKGENIRLIMERNQIKDAVYVGDTAGDARACKAAGVPMIYASYGFGEVEGEYLTIKKFTDLLDIDYEHLMWKTVRKTSGKDCG